MKYQVAFALFTLVAGCLGHMYPKSPCVRGSPLDNCGYPNPDYNLMAPIGVDNQPNFPLCHHTQPYASPVAIVQAGSSLTVNFETTAIHDGGHCEFSLSYDDGETFVAIHTILNTCFLSGKSFNVIFPKDAPDGKAIFSWSWVNKSGNREFYMTCSDIEVRGGGSGILRGPKMLTPNYDQDSPKIGEFGKGGDDGSNFYKQRPIIEITAGGKTASSGDQSKYSSVSAPNATKTSAATSPTNGTPTATSSYPSTTSPANDASSGDQSKCSSVSTPNATETSANTSPTNGTPTATSSYPSITPPANDASSGGLPQDKNSTEVFQKSDPALSGLATCVAIGKAPEYQIIVHGQTIKATCGATLVCKQTSVGGVYCDFP
ncbi:hypothetical protein IWQ61_008206 [Dispira simplex]|nr:hypothetical protein IWQ61_008206 [Dispira simplex]